MFEIALLMQRFWLSEPAIELNEIVLIGSTVIMPVVETVPQPPVRVIVYGNEPETIGEPEIVKVPAIKDRLIPAGRPL
jgi:hypothetical protein